MANFERSNPAVENYTYPSYFKLQINRIPGVVYNCQTANIPGVTVGVINTVISTKTGITLKLPSQSLEFDDLTVKFVVDENMLNWLEIYNWMQNMRVVRNWDTVQRLNDQLSEATIILLNSSYNAKKLIKFHNLFPISLGSVEFDSTITAMSPLVVSVVFAFETFSIVDA